MPDKKQSSGFTLVELMITLVIVAILAALAFPPYMDYLKRGKRAEAKVALFSAQTALERCFSITRNYQSTTTVAGNTYDCGVTQAIQRGEFFSDTGLYVLGFAAGTDPDSVSGDPANYTLQATAVSGMGMETDECGSFALDVNGTKGLIGASAGYDIDTCWNK